MDKFIKYAYKTFIYVFILLLVACSDNTKTNTAEETNIKIHRFERDLFSGEGAPHLMMMANKYKEFYFGFCTDILEIPENREDTLHSKELTEFIHHPSLLHLKHDVDSVYPDLEPIEAQLTEAMINYKKVFPNNKVPYFVSFVSEFGFANITYDTIIGIGLDMYLGRDYPIYPIIEFPKYMSNKLRKAYLASNAIKALAISNYEYQTKDKRFLAFMLFEGKVRYFMKKLLPELPDSIILGYTEKQVKWSKDNAHDVWAHFIEKKMLYCDEPAKYMRYLNDGPFTTAEGVPQESAPAIGIYTAYQIIQKYAEESGATLEQIMLESNWDKVLKESNYRP
jgi:hypothetical protein